MCNVLQGSQNPTSPPLRIGLGKDSVLSSSLSLFCKLGMRMAVISALFTITRELPRSGRNKGRGPSSWPIRSTNAALGYPQPFSAIPPQSVAAVGESQCGSTRCLHRRGSCECIPSRLQSASTFLLARDQCIAIRQKRAIPSSLLCRIECCICLSQSFKQ